MTVHPYVFFAGRAEEAIEFYRTAVGATVVMLMRNKESPEPHPPGMLPEGAGDKIMHATVRIGDSQVMFSDGMCDGKEQFKGFSLVLTVADDGDAERRFAALADGGKVTMPIGKAFFASRFGMCTDRFGVEWMVISGQQ